MNRMFCPNCGELKHKHTIHCKSIKIPNGYYEYTILSCGAVLEYRQNTESSLVTCNYS